MGELSGFTLLARRLPIIISNNPWIMGVGVLIIVIYLAMRASEKERHERSQYRGGLPGPTGAHQMVDDVRRLTSDPRYREAMDVFAEATRRGEREPLVSAVQYLESQGVSSEEARMNVMKILLVLHSLSQEGAPSPQ